MYISLRANYRLFMSDFNNTRIFLGSFSKNPQISNFMKVRRVGAELFRADRRRGGQTDGRTDMRKLMVAFCNFANALKNIIY